MPALSTAERLEFVKLGFVRELESVLAARREAGEKTAGAIWDSIKAFGRRSPGLIGSGAGAGTGALLGSAVFPGVGTGVGALVGGAVGGLGGQVGKLFRGAPSAKALIPQAMELMKTHPERYASVADAVADLQKAAPGLGGMAQAGLGTAALGAGALGAGAYGGYQVGKGGLETIRDTMSGGRSRGQDMGIGDVLKTIGLGAGGYYGANALSGALDLPPQVQQILPWLGALGGGYMGMGG